MKQKETKPED